MDSKATGNKKLLQNNSTLVCHHHSYFLTERDIFKVCSVAFFLSGDLCNVCVLKPTFLAVKQCFIFSAVLPYSGPSISPLLTHYMLTCGANCPENQ